MSVLITGVNMPSFGEGNELIVRVLPNGAVLDEHGIYLNAKAIPVPPHGRLVDADVLFDRMEFEIKHFVPTDEFSRGVLSGYRSATRASRYASTVIPASEEGE